MSAIQEEWEWVQTVVDTAWERVRQFNRKLSQAGTHRPFTFAPSRAALRRDLGLSEKQEENGDVN